MTPELLIRLGLLGALTLGSGIGGWMVNGWRLGAEIERLEAQGEVLTAAVEACSESVADGKRAGAAAIARGEELLAEARRLHAGGNQAVRRIEDLIKKKPPARADGKPSGCDEAWEQLEAASKARAP